MMILLDILPVSFSGIGTRELVLIFFLSSLGITTEAVVSFSILIMIFSYISMGIFGFIFWIKNPIKIHK